MRVIMIWVVAVLVFGYFVILPAVSLLAQIIRILPQY